MTTEATDFRKIFSGKRIFLAVIIGLLASSFLAYDGLSKTNWNGYDWSVVSLWSLLVAILLMVLRDFAYMLRIRVLTDGKLSWRQAFDVVILWEFASSLTPSVVGGSGFAIFILNQEKIPLGKSTAIVMVTAFLDELFYVIMVPLVLIFTGTQELFPLSLQKQILGVEFGSKQLFYVGYAFILILIGVIFYGLFIRPKVVKYWLVKIFSFRLLRKWRYKALETANNLIITSIVLKGKNFGFWLKAFFYTILSWSARFWVVNFILQAFNPSLNIADHLLIYARQLVMWVILLISPTPGGAGIAEISFSGFLEQFTPDGFAALQATLWRVLSYYPYILIGSILLPIWLRRVFKRKK
jgi:hypothetical protein